MARPLRIEYPGAFYHVISRGNARLKIFLSDADKKRCLLFLETGVHSLPGTVHSPCTPIKDPNRCYHIISRTTGQ